MTLPVSAQRRPTAHRRVANALLVMGVFVGVVLSGCATTKCAVCEACPSPQEIRTGLLGVAFEKEQFEVVDDGQFFEVKRK